MPVVEALRATQIVYDDTIAAQATYATQLTSLDVVHQKAVLSQMNLNSTQREAILNFAKLSAAGQSYTVGTLALAAGVDKARLAESLQLAETEQLTAETIACAVATGALRGEDAQLVIQFLTRKAATDGVTASTNLMNMSLKETAALMLATPMGWITMLTMLIPLLITAAKKFKELYDAAHPTLQQMQDDLGDAENELDELDGKLDENKKRIAELRALRDGGTISIVESEELKRLERENELLTQQIRLQKDLIAARQNDIYTKAAEDAGAWLSDNGYEIKGHGNSERQEQAYTGAGGLSAAINDYKTAKAAFDQAVANGAAAATDAEKKKFKEAADEYKASMETALARMVDLQEEAIKLRNALNPDDPESAGLIRELDLALDRIAALQDPEAARNSIFGRFFDAEADLTNEKIAEFNAYLKQLGLITEDIPKDELADMLRNTGDAAEDEADKIKGLIDVLDKFGVESKEIYAHGGNVDLLDRRVVEVTNANLGKVQTHDANAQVGDRMTVLSKTIQHGEAALVVTPILPNGEILSDAELDKYVEKVVKAAKKDKSTNYQAYDQKGVFLGVFGDHATFEKNNEEAEQFAERLHEIHEAILEAGSGSELSELVAELQDLTEYTPSVSTLAEKFADAEGKVEKLGKALQEFGKEGSIAADTLAEIGKDFGDYESYEKFAKVLMDSTSTMEEAQAAADALASEFMNSTTALDMLREGNADLVKAMLEKIGVTNADEVVESRLRIVRLEAKVAALGLADAEWSVVEEKLREIGATNADITAIEALRKKQIEAKIATTDFATANASTIATLIQMANAAGIAGKRMEILAQMQRVEASETDKTSARYGAYMADAKRRLLEGFTDDLKVELPEIKVVVPKADGSGSGSGSSSSKKETERYFAEIDRFRDAVKRLADAQEEAERLNGELGRTESLWDQVKIHKSLVDTYENEQTALHDLNEERRKAIREGVEKLQNLGFDVSYDAETNDLFINNLEHLNDLATTDLNKYETMADMSVNILGKYDNAQEATNGLIKDTEGIIDNITKFNDANKEGSETWWERRDAIHASKQSIIDDLRQITENAHDAVDEIQNVYDTLHAAADEFAANDGYLTIDTYQSILQLGTQYMAYLYDENGLLVINEERIQAVIAAKTEQLALEQALTYVERLRLALENGSIENLNELLYATQDATDATWNLVYANLKLLDLSDDQFAAALHNINAIRSLADAAVAGIGKSAGAFADSLNEMKDGLDSILRYTMDMLRQRIEDQIDALEEQKSAYGDLIDAQKEMLRNTKNQNDYQKSVASKLKEMAKLQKEIASLTTAAESGDRSAAAKRAKLQEELAELSEDLADEQNEHAIEVAEKALDKQQAAFEAEKDDEIKTLRNSISSQQKLYDMAISYIESRWDKLYGELIDWNTEYGSDLNSDITSAWDKAYEAAERYGSYVSALGSIDADIAATSGGNTHNDKLGSSTVNTKLENKENASIIASAMRSYSAAWSKNNTDAKNNELHEAAAREAAKLDQYGIHVEFDSGKGIWEITSDENDPKKVGQNFLLAYHSGGIVGGDASLKQDELFAKLQKGEMVLSREMVDQMIQHFDMLKKLGESIASRPMDGRLLAPDLAALGIGKTVNNVTSNESSRPVSIVFGDTHISGADKSTVQQHIRVTEDMVNQIGRMLGIGM